MITNVNTSHARPGDKKILVAWYSWSGNTEAVGKYVQELTNADVFVIEPVVPYSTEYWACTEEAKAEINAGRKRAIKGSVDIADYDIVVIGSPNWWSTIAPPVLSFLTEIDLAGKTIVPFVTHGGGREARCFTDMRRAVDGAEFLDGFAVSGNRAKDSKNDVAKWLKGIGILE